MFTVTGHVDGKDYTVRIAPEPTGEPGAVGVAGGDARVLVLLELHAGDTVLASPTGPEHVLDLRDPRSVLAGLQHLTTVNRIEGDAPETIPPVDPDVVY